MVNLLIVAIFFLLGISGTIRITDTSRRVTRKILSTQNLGSECEATSIRMHIMKSFLKFRLILCQKLPAVSVLLVTKGVI